MRSAIYRRLGAVLFLVALAFGAIMLGRFLGRRGLPWAANFGSIAAFFVACIALLTPLLGRVMRWLGGPLPIARIGIPQAKDDLAAALSRQWTTEERLRRINDPRPLPVRWEVTPTAQAAMPGVPHDVSDDDAAAGWAAELAGQFDDIVPAFYRVPSRRLVILGAAGAGKSVLAIKLARGLLAARRSGMAVPVIVPAATWDPQGEGLLDWLAGQLGHNHPGLAVRVRAATGETTTLAYALASDGVLPIIDGLDELPEPQRGKALTEINAVGSDVPLVVTCRPEEYLGAVAAAGRAVSRAVVVELLPLRVPQVETYLGEATAATLAGRWRAVFDRLDAEPDGPLTSALSTPLMLWLARTVYERSDSDPGELADAARFSDQETIEHHLLDAFIPAVYSSAAGSSPRPRFRCPRPAGAHLSEAGLAGLPVRDPLPVGRTAGRDRLRRLRGGRPGDLPGHGRAGRRIGSLSRRAHLARLRPPDALAIDDVPGGRAPARGAAAGRRRLSVPPHPAAAAPVRRAPALGAPFPGLGRTHVGDAVGSRCHPVRQRSRLRPGCIGRRRRSAGASVRLADHHEQGRPRTHLPRPAFRLLDRCSSGRNGRG